MRSTALGMLAILSLAPLSGHAADGVLEINQTCATATGCFPGDAAGLPVTIMAAAQARSFRLTSDLTTASSAQTMVSISVPSVTLDLGGFRIQGPAVCLNVPVSSCTGSGAGIGVAGGNDVSVRNGTITGIGGIAVNLTYSARVEGLNIFHSGGDGIVVTDLALVRGNIVTSGGGDGIRCRDYCVVSENTSTGHLGDGIQVTTGTVNGNTASLNGGKGGNFVGATSFAQNSFSGNVGEDAFGGHASGGNSCQDRTCSLRGARRYYLTTGFVSGDAPLTACAPGFHFAALWEIFDFGSLEYDERLGKSGLDGDGPPSGDAGWVRTGGSFSGSTAGTANCNFWTSTSGNGSLVQLDLQWENGNSGDVPPWIPDAAACVFVEEVWCVED